MKIDVTQAILEYNDAGELVPMADSKAFAISPKAVAYIPIDAAGEPIYLLDGREPDHPAREPRPLTFRRLVWKALNEGLPLEGEGSMPPVDKETSYPITSAVMVGDGLAVELTPEQADFILLWVSRRRSSWEWGQAKAMIGKAKGDELLAQARAEENLRAPAPPEPESAPVPIGADL